MQSKGNTAVRHWKQGCDQDVSDGPSRALSPFQTETPQIKVKASLCSPRKEILKLIIAFTKSILFAGGYTALVRRIVCLVSKNYKFIGCNNQIT